MPVSCSAEAMLPMAVSQKWVAHACRMAGIAKPRWNRHTCVWTTSAIGESGAREAIVITAGSERSVAIKVEWLAPEGATAESATARRLVTAFFTGMQWAVRRR